MSRTPDTATTLKMHSLYLDGKSLEDVAIVFGRTRQGVWDRFRRAGLKRRARIQPLPFVEFGGERYAPSKENYFRKTRGDRLPLHHAIWIKANGPIPRGHVVMFCDGDRMNTELDNLECLPKGEEITAGRTQHVIIKRCLACDQPRGRRLGPRESPSAYAKRKTCNSKCSADWKRGRARGTKMPIDDLTRKTQRDRTSGS